MGFEIPIDVNYFEHPKTMMLIGLIGPEADIYPLRLWRWCSMYARNGIIAGGRAQIESAVKWHGAVGVLCRALINAGFLEADGKTVHDFMDGIGRAVFLYEQKKLRQRAKYAAGILPEESGRTPPIPSHPGDSEKSQPGKPNPAEVLFERFWAAFPRIRKQGKGAARKAFAVACQKADAETIIAAAEEYSASPVGKGQFAKSPAAWLNQECWQDDRAAWNRSDNKTGASNAPDPSLFDPNQQYPKPHDPDAEIA